MIGDERTRGIWVLSLLFLVPIGATADPLFAVDDVLEIRIEGPFGSLLRHKKQREELPFVLSAEGHDHNLQIRVRGKSRAQVCSFPPLRLNFKKSAAVDTVFVGQDKLKLVTHCKNSDRGETNLLQEFIAYRALNVITDLSYRVRLLRANYVDTDQRLSKKASHRYGFLRESEAAFAARTGAAKHSAQIVSRAALDVDYAAVIFVYQYLVANTDWSLVRADGADDCCHNMDLYLAKSGILLVPYDLDLSGVVNAGYAFPDASLRIKHVTQRHYRGMCIDGKAVQEALRHVLSLRDDILVIPESTPGLTTKDARKTREYLNKFFVAAENEDALLKEFEKRCLKFSSRNVQ